MVIRGLIYCFASNLSWMSGSIFCSLGRVSHLWFGFGKFPVKNCQIFQFFSTSGKKNLFGSGQKVPGAMEGWPLIYCGSKVCWGQGLTISIAEILLKLFILKCTWYYYHYDWKTYQDLFSLLKIFHLILSHSTFLLKWHFLQVEFKESKASLETLTELFISH